MWKLRCARHWKARELGLFFSCRALKPRDFGVVFVSVPWCRRLVAHVGLGLLRWRLPVAAVLVVVVAAVAPETAAELLLRLSLLDRLLLPAALLQLAA